MPFSLMNGVNALGAAFGGYGQDKDYQAQLARQRLQDSMQSERLGMDRQNFQSEAQRRADETASQTARDALNAKRTQMIQDNYQKAIAGDKQAQALLVSIDPSMASQFMPKPARKTYDATRGVMVNEDDATVQQIPGLPQIAAKEPTPHWVGAGVDPTTNQPLLLNTLTGETKVGGGIHGGAGQGGATAQLQQARMLAAISEARLADERMRAYEDSLLSGKKKISPFMQAAGSLSTNLADTHSAVGALTQSGSEFALNNIDPEYAQYLRDASTIGRAEQMISPRGGNETMVRANALLSRAGTGAVDKTINASRMARHALFGSAGGIEQTLTPQQSTGVRTGLERIKAEGSAPNVPSVPSVPSYEDWKKKNGIP